MRISMCLDLCILFLQVCVIICMFFEPACIHMCVNVCLHSCVCLNVLGHILFDYICVLLPFVHECRQYPAYLCMKVFFHSSASYICACVYTCMLNVPLCVCVCICVTESMWALVFPYLYEHAYANMFVTMNVYRINMWIIFCECVFRYA